MSNISRDANMALAVRALQKLSLEDCIRVMARRIGEQTMSKKIEDKLKSG